MRNVERSGGASRLSEKRRSNAADRWAQHGRKKRLECRGSGNQESHDPPALYCCCYCCCRVRLESGRITFRSRRAVEFPIGRYGATASVAACGQRARQIRRKHRATLAGAGVAAARPRCLDVAQAGARRRRARGRAEPGPSQPAKRRRPVGKREITNDCLVEPSAGYAAINNVPQPGVVYRGSSLTRSK